MFASKCVERLALSDPYLFPGSSVRVSLTGHHLHLYSQHWWRPIYNVCIEDPRCRVFLLIFFCVCVLKMLKWMLAKKINKKKKAPFGFFKKSTADAGDEFSRILCG